MDTKYLILICTLCLGLLQPAFAQEVCFEDAKTNFSKWRSTHGKTLDELSAKYLASKDPHKELVTYNKMRMPIAAALIIEGEKYGREADEQLTLEVDGAQKCAGQTTTVRGVYDAAREYMGLTTILPERATKVDWERIRRGDVAGGKNSVVREAGRTIDRVLNPFRW